MTLNEHRVALLASAEAFADACTSEALRRTVDVELQPGERYAGLLLNEDGTPSHHVVLLPGEAEDITWPKACEWAASVGGELPSRREQSLLFANAKSSFQETWYWSGEARDDGSFAWTQYFGFGVQSIDLKSYGGRARAVRRFAA